MKKEKKMRWESRISFFFLWMDQLFVKHLLFLAYLFQLLSSTFEVVRWHDNIFHVYVFLVSFCLLFFKLGRALCVLHVLQGTHCTRCGGMNVLNLHMQPVYYKYIYIYRMCVDTHVYIDKLILRIKLQWSDAFSLLMKSIVCSSELILFSLLCFFFILVSRSVCCCRSFKKKKKYSVVRNACPSDVIESSDWDLSSMIFFSSSQKHMLNSLLCSY